MAKAPVARTGVGWTGWAPLLSQVIEQLSETHTSLGQGLDRVPRVPESRYKDPDQASLLSPTAGSLHP